MSRMIEDTDAASILATRCLAVDRRRFPLDTLILLAVHYDTDETMRAANKLRALKGAFEAKGFFTDEERCAKDVLFANLRGRAEFFFSPSDFVAVVGSL
jgi:hypothetical protein